MKRLFLFDGRVLLGACSNSDELQDYVNSGEESSCITD